MIRDIIYPKNWKRNDPKSISEWMEKLPTVKNLCEAEEIDKRYEKMVFLSTFKPH